MVPSWVTRMTKLDDLAASGAEVVVRREERHVRVRVHLLGGYRHEVGGVHGQVEGCHRQSAEEGGAGEHPAGIPHLAGDVGRGVPARVGGHHKRRTLPGKRDRIPHRRHGRQGARERRVGAPQCERRGRERRTTTASLRSVSAFCTFTPTPTSGGGRT